MHVLKSRLTAFLMAGLFTALVPGCMVDSSSSGDDESSGPMTHVKLSPDVNLHAAPEGYQYEFWILMFDTVRIVVVDTTADPDTNISFIRQEPGDAISLVRFQWDPYLYAATDTARNYLPLTVGNGMDLGFDVGPLLLSGAPILTIEPIEGLTSEDKPGPIFLTVSPISGVFELVNAFTILEDVGFAPTGSFNLLSQSNKYGVPGASWRDDATEGLGIWFANPRLEDGVVIDEERGWTAYEKTLFQNDTAYSYIVWYDSAFPESSFSNFGKVLQEHEPDFEFRDGVPIHAQGRCGPRDFCAGSAVQGTPQPIFDGGVVVGYRYIVRNNSGRIDTCDLRIDNPSLSRCNRDSFDTLYFDTTSFLPRVFRTTGGDTSMAPSLIGLIDISDSAALAELTEGFEVFFLGWEYEAWLVFTDESGIAPMSLGRFKRSFGFDSGNPYTNNANYNPYFFFPGEDFLQNLAQHDPSLPSPFDVIHDPRAEKVWVTIEPDDDNGGDWAPDDPNTQLIYMAGFIPKVFDTSTTALRTMQYRDLNPSPVGLNEGNQFPVVDIEFNSGP